MPELNQDQVRYIQEKFKIPVDRDTYPQKDWIASLSIESEMPIDDELRQLRSFIEFELLQGIYDRSYGQRVLDKPLPLVSGHNTLIFRKVWEENTGWYYRRKSWEYGPKFVPWVRKKDFRPHALVQAMDREMKNLTSLTGRWVQWKAEHPDIFPPT